MADDNKDDKTVDSLSETVQVSQAEEARTYISNLLESEAMRDLQAVLQGANAITKQTWVVQITADGYEIKTDD